MSAPSIHGCDKLRAALPADAKIHLDRILNGRVSGGDVEVLYFLLPEPLRGAILLCLHHWNVPSEFLRECIRHFWKVDNCVILKGPGFSLELAREVFRRARFPLPPDIPPVVQVWRGTTGRTVEQACEGLCWTLDSDAACWFATLYENREPGNPIVVTATVRAEHILFLDQNDGLHESEVVVDRISGGEIDTDSEAGWRARARLYIEKRKRAGC